MTGVQTCALPISEESPVYLELKRKYDGVVYKRRVQTTVPQADAFFSGGEEPGPDGQIRKEIARFRDHYQTLIPSCLIVCDRTAYFEEAGDLRLTIDRNPRYRREDLRLTGSLEGLPLLPEGWTILEVKVQQAMPLWLSHSLSEGGIFKSSFSKYGEAYRRLLTGEDGNPTLFLLPKLSGAA